ncbi:Nop domain-containing protein [Tuber magnatum]|uniref:Nop domain-containing protein n=1 Tax=Tuber magnatum TaxID=42249 RepID=A0A317SPU4_9PEZI|nr:Nop domain-containing protein [Tuber magnatum]
MAESSLAADLLADFNDDSDHEDLDLENEDLNVPETAGIRPKSRDLGLDGDEESDEDEEMEGTEGAGGTVGNGVGARRRSQSELADDDDEEARKVKVEKMHLGGVDDVRSVAGLMKILEPVLEQIQYYKNLPPAKGPQGNVEDNPEYKLLVQSNAHAVSIDNEIILVHKFIRDHYAVRFPELENLVTNPLDYAKTVSVIGNDLDIKTLEARNGNRLRQVLDGPTLMVVTVEATTTSGRDLTEKELAVTMRACEMTQALDAAKRTITAYVESRMSMFAPNTSAIVGSQTAAQLINFAGGLRGLAATPACNIAALGSKRQTQTGLATNIGIRQQGYIFHSPIIREIPTDLKVQAMRIVSAKLILAARVDFSHSSPDGSQGEELKEQVLEKLEKLTIPPPNKGPKALPAPDDKPARKRGGRRARKAKEATAMTDLRKAQNRMAFGKQEEETGYGVGDSAKGLGMIGQEQNGRIRALQVDQRTRAKLGKYNPGWASAAPVGGAQSILGSRSSNGPGLAALGGGARSSFGAPMGLGSGTASSLAFTPVQGIELIDPKVAAERKRKAAAEDDRYFAGGTFSMVGGGGSSVVPHKEQGAGRGKNPGMMLPPPLPKK